MIYSRKHKVVSFLCDCTDKNEWLARLEKRLMNPMPNQYFKNIKEIYDHYNKMNIKLVDNEFYIDSCNKVEIIIQQVMEHIKSCCPIKDII
ncbi:hypothetical protein SDC9_118084 [bioreactor metagenome]|uniref:Uncharacterized protein n=1 Tax=bioreactor metagenome TaxID=1076179 RepID=A0A645C2F1_9ZZZZ